MKKQQQWIKSKKRILIGIGTIVLIISMVIIVDVFSLLLKILLIGLFGIILFIVLYNLSFLFRAYKLKLIFKTLGHNISFINSFYSLGACFFINDLTPGKLGDFTKILFIKDQENIQLSDTICGISIERTLDIFFLFFISLLALIYLFFYNGNSADTIEILGQSLRFYLLFGALLLFCILIFFFILIYKTDFIINFLNKISSILANYFRIFILKFKEGIKSFKNQRKKFIYINLLNFPTYIIDASITILFFYLLGYQLNIIILIFAIILTYFSRIIPITPGGWGISENVGSLFIFLFYPEIPYSEILSVFIIDHIIRSVYIFFFGGYSIVNYNIKLKEIEHLKKFNN